MFSEAIREQEGAAAPAGSAIIRKAAKKVVATEEKAEKKKAAAADKAEKKAGKKAGKGKAKAAAPASRIITDPSTLKVPAGDERVRQRVEAARTLKVGEVREFTGRDEALRGKKVTVVGFRPDGGLYVETSAGDRLPVAPWSVGIEKPGARAKKEAKKEKAPKAAKAAKKKK